ncbi:hypothetical protein GCM10007301_35870 [Azorhizobium oxalatiphilum]|uniref:Biotin carboxylation domain-containing protein n=1 Tax=Azorhizobium oxalatiphilum TaxID=980631 RepID=A0A917C5B8_9HYPH|nr:glycosyltransferase family 2 protein [Azorhizobium oxalatiphilum]GGF72879.1 hypothetical protein GCM10007301_35870 [Azorhizobium oxalatiphilum]
MAIRNSEQHALLERTIANRRNRSLFRKLWTSVRPRLRARSSDVAVVRQSLFFDADWYVSTYPDVAGGKLDPAAHFVRHGAREDRDPGPFFSTSTYRRLHLDSTQGHINPLVHFETVGCTTGCALALSAESSAAWWHDRLHDHDRAAVRRHIAHFKHKPLLSVCMILDAPDETWLRDALGSLAGQVYPLWDLRIMFARTEPPHIQTLLERAAAEDHRVVLVPLAPGLPEADRCNAAIYGAKGDFALRLGQHDRLHETALYEIANRINLAPDADVLYSDDDVVDAAGAYSSPHFRTSYDPELLLGQGLTEGLAACRTALLAAVGGFRPGYGAASSYDLILRACAFTSMDRIHHIPELLYHRRARTPDDAEIAATAEARQRVRRDAVKRRGENTEIRQHPRNPVWARIVRPLPAIVPKVSVIVPTRDRADLLAVCARGVLETTRYPDLELIIVDHQSREAATLRLFDELRRDRRVRIIPFVGEFNFSAINNFAMSQSQGDVIALLNNDIEITHPDWLEEMVPLAMRPDTGAVGAKLYYPDGTIQHAGVVAGLGGPAGHAFAFAPGDTLGDHGRAVLTRTVSAVTAACLVIRREAYQGVGGFNAEELPVAFNDIDLCFRLQRAGYRNVWTPFAELVHHESASRGKEETPEQKARFARDEAYMQACWGDLIRNDPFYNPNLSLTSADYARAPSRRDRPWKDYF